MKSWQKRWEIFNICLINTNINNSFIGIRELIPTNKIYKCLLKNNGNFLAHVQQIYLIVIGLLVLKN